MMLLALLVVAAPATETPKAYMERVYASYRDKDFSPFDHPNLYFAPRLLSAIKEDARLAHGEVGYVDGDPICQCQDAGGLHASIKSVALNGTDRATVSVQLDFPDSTPTRVRLSLVRTGGGWRIADIWAADQPSLLKVLETANRRARRH